MVKSGKNAVKYKAPVVIEAEQNPQCYTQLASEENQSLKRCDLPWCNGPSGCPWYLPEMTSQNQIPAAAKIKYRWPFIFLKPC